MALGILKRSTKVIDDKTPVRVASQWALTPDEGDPSTWQLPLYDDDGVLPSKRRIAAALGCLSADAYPTIPVKQARVVRGRIRAAWQVLYGPDAPLPEPLRKAGDLFEPVPIDVNGNVAGIMVALAPPAPMVASLVLDDVTDVFLATVPEQMHVTLAYLGPYDASWDEQSLADLVAVVNRWVAVNDVWPKILEVTGVAQFVADPATGLVPYVALLESIDLGPTVASLKSALVDAGFVTFDQHGYLPHITLGYGLATAALVLDPPQPVAGLADAVLVCSPGNVVRVPLDGQRLAARTMQMYGDYSMFAYAKAAGSVNEEQRYTFSPLYVPDSVDSHGEWASADQLQAAVWEYVQKGDRALNYEHHPEVKAGVCVEIVAWPLPVTCTLETGTGETSEVELPAGTVYQGVIWEGWAWDEVKAGNINALSMEGLAARRVGAPEQKAASK